MKACGFENQINLYLDGELSGAKLAAFEAHLQRCPQCREEVEQYRGMLDALHGLEDREVPPALQDRLHAALSNEIAKGDGRVRRKFNPWALTAVAAAVVLFVSVGVVAAGGGIGLLNKSSGDNLRLMDKDRGGTNGFTGAAVPPQNIDVGEDSGSYGYEPAPVPMPAATAAAPEMQSPEEKPADYTKGGEGFAAEGQGRNFSTTSENTLTKPVEGRKIIFTAYLSVETRDYNKCVATINTLVGKFEGYRENSQESGVPDAKASTMGRTAVISIRIPLDNYNAAINELTAMGNVLDKQEKTDDVSRQYVDTDSRNKTLKGQRDRYMALLEKADTTESIIALQNEITRLTVEIEQMTAQLNYWDDKVSYSTITVELRELVTPKEIKPVDPDLNDRMNGAFNTTLNNMKKGLEDFSVRFVGFLPWLAIILLAAGLLAAILIPVARGARRRRAIATKQKEE